MWNAVCQKYQHVLLHQVRFCSMQASVLFLTHNPLHSGKYVTCVTCHSDMNKAETDDRWLTEWQALQWQITAHWSVSTVYVLWLVCTVSICEYCCCTKWLTESTQWDTSGQIWPQRHSQRILAQLVLQIVTLRLRQISESKFKAHYHDRAVCASCMHTTCNSMYFVRAAAVHTTSKKQNYAILTLNP